MPPRTLRELPKAYAFSVTYRALLRVGSVVVAVSCLGVAAYLAFDWADYGSDSTCGNFIRYKGAGGTCAHIMRGRVFGVVALIVASLVLLGLAWTTRQPRLPISES
jgi:hypothetical protein